MAKQGVTGKLNNEYQKLIAQSFYERCPKAVFAAIAVSYIANMANVSLENVTDEMFREWRVLYEQGIVPQKPTKL